MIIHESPNLYYIRHFPSIAIDDYLLFLLKRRRRRIDTESGWAFWRPIIGQMKRWGLDFDPRKYKTILEYERKNDMKWEFATIRLTEADKVPLQEYVHTHDNDPENILQELLSAGFKVSISFVDDQSAFVVTISGSERSKRNQGWSLSSWSDDFWEAVSMAGYKHFVLCDGKDWADLDKGKSSWG